MPLTEPVRSPRAYAAIACLLATAIVLGASILGLPAAGAISNVLSPGVTAVAAALALLAAADAEGRLRRAWALMGLAMIANLCGDLVWTWLEATVEEPPYPSIADPFYLAFYPLFLAGLASLPAAPTGGRERLRLGLDLAVAFTGAAMVVFEALIVPTASAYGADVATQFVAASAPVGDLVLLVGMATVLGRRPTGAAASSLRALVAGVACFVAADLWYVWIALTDTYDAGDLVDVGWIGGFALFALAALPRGAAAEAVPVAPRPVVSALPYLGIVLGFGLLGWTAWKGHEGNSVAGVLVGAGLLCGLVIARQLLAARENEALTAELAHQNAALAVEQQRSERLLLNILPGSVASRLKESTGGILADLYPEATVLFADLVGFTALSARTPPEVLVQVLNDVFSRFDRLAELHGLEKIKTIGDAYMAAAGVPEPRPDHAQVTAAMALAMVNEVAEVNRARGLSLEVRVGIHSGPVVAGVIGERKFIYDLWGDTVNVASRMESHGVVNGIQISAAVRERLGDDFACDPRGSVQLKGKGAMETFLLRGQGRGHQGMVPA